MKKFTLACSLSIFFIFSCSVLSNKVATEKSESSQGKIIETLVSRKRVVTEITGDAAKATNLKFGSVIDVEIDPAHLTGIKYEFHDVYSIRCLEGGTKQCQTLDWALCPSSGCPTPKREGEK